MVDGKYPTMEFLNTAQGENESVYRVGFVIGEFIIETWGYSGMRSLIVNHGDVTKTFNLSQTEFEAQWYAFVKNKYL